MQVKDVMSNEIVMVSPSESIENVAKLMRAHDIGCIPVCENGHIRGVVTDRDLVTRSVAGSTDKSAPVGDVMSHHISVAVPMMDVDDAARLMAAQKVRRLPVVEHQKVVGMVSLGDLATESYALQSSKINALKEISEKKFD